MRIEKTARRKRKRLTQLAPEQAKLLSVLVLTILKNHGGDTVVINEDHTVRKCRMVRVIWEGDDPKESKKITYRELHDQVCRMANVLRNRNVEKGDRVTIYLPMIPEA